MTFNSPTFPIVFVRPTDGRLIRLVKNTGNSYTFHCVGAFDYWIFNTPPPDTAQNVGLQIFNEQGQVVYTSVARPLKIHGQYSYTRAAKNTTVLWILNSSWPANRLNSGPIATVNLGGSNFAFSPLFPSFASSHTTQPAPYDEHHEYATVEGLRATSTGFEVREYLGPGVGITSLSNYMPTVWGLGWFNPPGQILVADISGL